MSYTHNPEGKNVVIIGGVAGGASTAARLRRLDESLNITIIEKGPFASFANCGLPYFIGNVIPNEKSLLLVTPTVFNHKFNINLMTNSEVVSINTTDKSVDYIDLKTQFSHNIKYDYLVISTGNKPNIPDIDGIDLPNIFSLSNIPDARKIKTIISHEVIKKAVVIGSGYIGLEMVENLMKRGLSVTLVEPNDHLYPVFDKEMSSLLYHTLLEKGVTIKYNMKINRITENNEILTVHLGNGEIIDTNIIFMDYGVKPNSDLAIKAGLEAGINSSIKVDSFLKTSNEYIYACGDAIQVENYITKLPDNSTLASAPNREGRIIADCIAGKPRKFRGVQNTAVCGVFGYTLASTGINESKLKSLNYEYTSIYIHAGHHVEYYPGSKPIHMKLIYNKHGKIYGAQAYGIEGVEKRIDVISTMIQMNGTVEDLMETELCYTPLYNGAKDPVNYLGMIATNNINGLVKIADWNKVHDNFVLDIRSPIEHLEGLIPNSFNIPHCDLRKNMGKLPKDKPIYIICREGKFAYNCCRTLTQSGFDTYLLSGGIHTYHMVCNNKLLKGSAGNRPESFGCCENASKFV